MNRKGSVAIDAAVSLVVFLGPASAVAKDITGTPDPDVLVGTRQRDTIRGLAGGDDITPGKGDDQAFGDEGSDFFRWKNGDGHDQIDGGSGPAEFEQDLLSIDPAGKPLRLHL